MSCKYSSNQPDRAGNLYSISITGTPATLTSAGGQLAAPHGQGGVEARQLRLPLQVVSHVAVKAGDASGEQVQHGNLAEVWPLWQRAAQPEDCVEAEESRFDITSIHLPTSNSSSCPSDSFHSEVTRIKFCSPAHRRIDVTHHHDFTSELHSRQMRCKLVICSLISRVT